MTELIFRFSRPTEYFYLSGATLLSLFIKLDHATIITNLNYKNPSKICSQGTLFQYLLTIVILDNVSKMMINTIKHKQYTYIILNYLALDLVL